MKIWNFCGSPVYSQIRIILKSVKLIDLRLTSSGPGKRNIHQDHTTKYRIKLQNLSETNIPILTGILSAHCKLKCQAYYLSSLGITKEVDCRFCRKKAPFVYSKTALHYAIQEHCGGLFRISQQLIR